MLFLRRTFVLFWVNATVGSELLCCVYLFPPESCATYVAQPAVVCILNTRCLHAAGKPKLSEGRADYQKRKKKVLARYCGFLSLVFFVILESPSHRVG